MGISANSERTDALLAIIQQILLEGDNYKFLEKALKNPDEKAVVLAVLNEISKEVQELKARQSLS